ncbi:MAG: GNAT family N-acetyltransferase [Bdellovibrionia bacterium]
MSHNIRRISAQDTLYLRQKVLKPFLQKEECLVEGDLLETTHHWGFFLENQLVSVATFIAETHPDFSAKKSYRLRGMATDLDFAGMGIGSKLLKFSEQELINQNVDFLWFNARIKAFPFYVRLGFQFYGEMFELDRIGPHKTMYKYLETR